MTFIEIVLACVALFLMIRYNKKYIDQRIEELQRKNETDADN